MTRAPLILPAVLLLAACGDRPAERNTAPPASAPAVAPAPAAVPEAAPPPAASAAHRFQSWAGRWIGPEGLFVEITPTTAEHYRLEMQSDLDTRGTYEGRDDEHGIRFTRNGEALMLYRASGDDTGLKYLAGKRQCLMVKPGEGFCRD